MYLFFGILILILILFFCINHWRKKKIIKKICSLCIEEKCRLLTDLIEPFGYLYILPKNIFSSRTDAWQREFGYCTLYDRTAYHFNMNFDCLPVYFNYDGKTWLIEFWKGQYGINTGCEIGVYYADRILNEDELDTTLFQCVEDKDMLNLSFTLFRNDTIITRLTQKQWWLTAFSMGCFSTPADLALRAFISFPNCEMASAFLNSLKNTQSCPEDIYAYCNSVAFTFSQATSANNFLRKLRICIGQWMNRFFCKLYLFITRPFDLSIDRLLYLYHYLPFAFRRMLRIRRYKKYKAPRR